MIRLDGVTNYNDRSLGHPVGSDVSVSASTFAANSYSTGWSSCFGPSARGTIRARERRALVIASAQALINLLNTPDLPSA